MHHFGIQIARSLHAPRKEILMKRSLNLPTLTCSLLLALAQPSFAQTSSTHNGTGNKTGTNASTDTSNTTGTDRNKGKASGTGTSVGNHSDISGGTTNTGSKNANPKTVKDSRHCAANEDFVKQGDHMVCIPRATNDRGLPMGKEQSR
jgi:hypothetical protein